MGNFKGHRAITRYVGNEEDAWFGYQCSHCNRRVSGAVVAACYWEGGVVKWLQCPNCGDGSVLTTAGRIIPGVLFGPDIQGLKDNLLEVYSEARKCTSVGAFSACELICRKILMYVAVDKGAEQGKSFTDYLDFLENKGFITSPMKGWVDLIRQHGNKATHILENVDNARAESTLMFTAELLRLVYEMEFLAKQYMTK